MPSVYPWLPENIWTLWQRCVKSERAVNVPEMATENAELEDYEQKNEFSVSSLRRNCHRQDQQKY
ncbi:hypothetical protein [Idiomarina sp.]|uniref:hypothetical protein n=1 Tax=Idiomarina sp. TaxID=1874361 RepID=UPI003A8CF356